MVNKVKLRRISRIFVLVSGILFSGSVSGVALAGSSPGPLSIVATTSKIAEIFRVIGGNSVAVQSLMGPGVDPHGYRLTRSDVVTLARAQLIVWHGLDLEAQLAPLMGEFTRRKRVVAIAELIPRSELLEHPIYPGRFDPHIWMDPRLWTKVVEIARGILVESLPGLEADINRRAGRYISHLNELNRYAKQRLDCVPEENRVLITAHDAFGYFSRAYDFQVEGIQGISTQSEAGLARIGELVQLLVEKQIPAVFGEASVADRNIRALVEGALASGHQVKMGGDLYSDSMGSRGEYEGTYVGMFDHNISTIATALSDFSNYRNLEDPDYIRAGISVQDFCNRSNPADIASGS